MRDAKVAQLEFIAQTCEGLCVLRLVVFGQMSTGRLVLSGSAQGTEMAPNTSRHCAKMTQRIAPSAMRFHTRS